MLHLKFNKVKLHNFGCYTDAELELNNKGFCLVSGVNYYEKDNAESNGAGKSFLWNAICYAITGETIQGLSKNLNNLLVSDTKMQVELEFSCGGHDYTLIRGQQPTKFLHIKRNGVDISGKTYSESVQRLQEELPDLTKELIASTVIIGQGMPNRFSSFSPSGRKDLLEKLTKSDFMIEDIKQRVVSRQGELVEKIRELEDTELIFNTKITTAEQKQHQLEKQLLEITKIDHRALLDTLSTQLKQLEAELDEITIGQKQVNEARNLLTNNLIQLSESKATSVQREYANYSDKLSEISTKKATLSAQLNALQAETRKIKAIKDICPTCGQKIPGVVKPDTTAQELEIQKLNEALTEVEQSIKICNQKHLEYTQAIGDEFDQRIIQAEQAVMTNRQEGTRLESQNIKLQKQIRETTEQKSRVNFVVEHQVSQIKELESELIENQKLQEDLKIKVKELSNARSLQSQHLAIVKKMDSLIKRDFRGFLLLTLIKQLDSKAKEFSKIVFGTDELSIGLDGNALDITYCNKLIDNLSGGEKTRVDLILQLSIRAILADYLGVKANLLVLDEVTDFLDRKSCKAVMKLLSTELNTTESVFIISHRANELELPIDSEITVIKDDSGLSHLA